MTFEDFARAHGLIIRSITPHKWVATPTGDHPKKQNGRYKFLGEVGWVQNWATMDRPAIWKSQSYKPVDYARVRQQEAASRADLAQKAAAKAGWILHQSKLATHPYLEKKGFSDEQGNVWERDGKRILVVPMRSGGKIVGCQLIDEDGGKKFLSGQTSKGAVFSIDAKGLPIFCEGYATGLSIRSVMRAIKIRYSIYICFSASNLESVAGGIDGGFVVADNDVNNVGEKAAKAAHKPYWISPAIGEDFNDFHQRVGLFHASQSLKKIILAGSSSSETSPLSA